MAPSKKSSATDKRLSRIYYNASSPGSFGGVKRLWEAANRGKKGRKLRISTVRKWLESQDPYSLHKVVRRKFKRRRVVVGGMYTQLQADLIDVTPLKSYNKGNKFILTAIDIFSKYAWAIPLKNKSADSVRKAVEEIVESCPITPLYFQTDKGKEFVNKQVQQYLKSQKIDFFTTENVEIKASIVERFNRTLKNRMWRSFTHRGTFDYISILPQLIKSYNHQKHSSHGFQPVAVNSSNQETVWQNLYSNDTSAVTKRRSPKNNLTKGTRVRLSIERGPFRKGYVGAWTEEIFTVSDIIPSNPVVYKITDDSGDRIKGTFYRQELQPVDKSKQVYRVEKVVGERKVKGKKYAIVKWMGYGEEHNSVIPKSDLRKYS